MKTNIEIKEEISKSKLKKYMHDLQNLGLRLTTLSKDQLIKININENLINEIEKYKKINSNSAGKRQIQYIRKLISKLDDNTKQEIDNFFSVLDGNNKVYQAKTKKIENIIEKLLTQESYITDYINKNNNINISEFRTLIRNTKKDKIENKITKNYKLLYNLIKSYEF